MKARTLIFIILAILVVYAGIQCMRSRASAKQDDAGKRPTAKVEKGELSVSVIESGTVEAVQSVEVKSRVSGRIQSLLVNEGDRVVKGQLIAVIDPEELNLQLKQSSAQLRGAESGAARSRASIDITAKQLQDAVIQAQARYNLALRDWKNQPELSRTSVEQSRLAYEAAQRSRDLLVNVTQPQERVQVESTLSQAEASYNRDKANVARVQGLLDKGYVPLRDLEEAKARLAASEGALATAREAKTRLDEKQRVETRNAEESVKQSKAAYDASVARADIDRGKLDSLNQARSALAQAQSDLRRVQLERLGYQQSAAQADQIRATVADSRRLLGETQIRAPMSGIVTRKAVEPGELVSALSSFSGGTTIVEIADLNSLQVKLLINEIDVAKLKKQVTASVDVDAIPSQKFEGAVERIAPASQAASAGQGAVTSSDAVVKYEVIVRLSSADERIKPGMSAKCTIFVEKRENVLKVPVEYVTKDDKGYSVLVIPAGKKAGEKRDVKIGLITDAFYEVVDGLKVGEELQKPEYKGPPRTGMMGPG
ncbi:MAG: efflux RND transporter periplasmic adaptor subunit [Fimbriimonadales bacterium]